MTDTRTARRRLRVIATELRGNGEAATADEIEDIVSSYLLRRRSARRTPRKSRTMTNAIRQEIVRLARDTDMSSAEIAAAVDVNPGRVSEILNP